MKKNVPTTEPPKMSYLKCESCRQRIAVTRLYCVRDKKICLLCVTKEIAERNRIVKDAERS